MLTMSLDRLSDLLNKAAEVDLAEAVLAEEEADTEAAGEEATDALEEAMAEDPAYLEFIEAIEGLSRDEIYELLALGLVARNEAAAQEWPAMVEQARAIPDEDMLDELIRMLLLTDEIEAALDQLGYTVEDEEEEEEEEEEDEGEEEEEADGKDKT